MKSGINSIFAIRIKHLPQFKTFVMKQILAFSFVSLIFTATFAQDYKTGNTEFDASLSMISTNAKSDMLGFGAQMKSEYHISDSK